MIKIIDKVAGCIVNETRLADAQEQVETLVANHKLYDNINCRVRKEGKTFIVEDIDKLQ